MNDFLSTPIKTRLACHKAGQRMSKPTSYAYRWGGEAWGIGGSRYNFGRFHESPENVFRLVGKAHELNRSIRHKGWYTADPDGGLTETTHGLVFRLNHGRGFLVACSDPDNEGAAIFEVRENGQPVIYDDQDNAVSASDEHARIYAEACREDFESSQEEMRLEDERQQAEDLAAMVSAE